jgi:hypothetical protein
MSPAQLKRALAEARAALKRGEATVKSMEALAARQEKDK